jgi:hypothetical protein
LDGFQRPKVTSDFNEKPSYHIPMSRKVIQLSLAGTNFPVPQRSLLDLIDHNRELLDANLYEVKSAVPSDLFQQFVTFLTTNEPMPITPDNVAHLSLLAQEFFLEDLSADCEKVVPNAELSISDLVDRIAALERRVSGLECLKILSEQVTSHERELEVLSSRLLTAEHSIVDLPLHTSLSKSIPDDSARPDQSIEPESPIRPPPPTKIEAPPVEDDDPRFKIECPLKEGEPFDGIIVYLTKRFGGNRYQRDSLVSFAVLDKHVMSIDGSGYSSHNFVRNCLDLTPSSTISFSSPDQANSWVRWNFTDFRVRLTNYTLRSYYLKSWVLEGSIDNKNWTEMDRQTTTQYFREKDWVSRTFPIAKPVECRYVLLKQTSKNHNYDNCLYLAAAEFFGTVIE